MRQLANWDEGALRASFATVRDRRVHTLILTNIVSVYLYAMGCSASTSRQQATSKPEVINNSSVATRAVSKKYLQQFLTEHPDAANMTTTVVVESIIRAATAQARCSFAQLGNQPPGSFGPATHFISHAWAGNFGELVSVILDIPETDGPAFFWLDIFAICQHTNDAQAEELGQLADVLMRARSTVAVLTPWQAPVAVSRVWCLYEYMVSCSSSKRKCL